MHAFNRFALALLLLTSGAAALAEDVDVGTSLPRFSLV